MQRNLNRPPIGVPELLANPARQGLIKTVEELRGLLLRRLIPPEDD
jgi:hypothetical protein